jgi:hypothetical protein
MHVHRCPMNNCTLLVLGSQYGIQVTDTRRSASTTWHEHVARTLKRTVPRNFSPLVFFVKQLLLVSIGMPRKYLIFKININEGIRYFRCFTGVIDTGNANITTLVTIILLVFNGCSWRVILPLFCLLL